MFWICKNCFSLYEANVGKCRECGGTEFIRKAPEEKVEFVTAAPPPVPGTVSADTAEAQCVGVLAEGPKETSSVYPVGQEAVNVLQRALEFIKNQQELDFQKRCREYEPQYSALYAQYEKETLEFQKALELRNVFQKRADRQSSCITAFFIAFWLGIFGIGLHNRDWDLLSNFGDALYIFFILGILLFIWRVVVHAFWMKISKSYKESQKAIPIPQAPAELPPYPDTDADFERYFEFCPDPPIGKEYFRPIAISRLIAILENRLAETLPEAMRFMVAEDRADREHREEMRVMNEMNRHAEAAASSASSAASAARNASTMATIGTVVQVMNMANRRK